MAAFEKIVLSSKLLELAGKKHPPETLADVASKLIATAKNKSVSNNNAYVKTIVDARKGAQATLDAMQKSYDDWTRGGPTPNPYALPTIKAGLKIIETHLQACKQSSRDLVDAQLDWRGSWPNAARTNFQNIDAAVDAALDERRKQVDNQTTMNSLVSRIEEYQKRALGIIKDSEAAYKESMAMEAEAGDIRADLSDLQKQCKDIETTSTKEFPKFKNIQAWIDKKDKKNAVTLFKNLDPVGKNLRGSLKTAEGDYSRLKKAIGQSKQFSKEDAEMRADIDRIKKSVQVFSQEAEKYSKLIDKM